MLKKMQIGNQRSPRLYLICLMMFAVASLVLKQYYLAAAEAIICLILIAAMLITTFVSALFVY